MGFPNYRRGGLFQLFRMVPFNWVDKGEVKGIQQDLNCTLIKGCVICNSILRVGKEHKQIFRYCPKCLIKTYIHNYDT